MPKANRGSGTRAVHPPHVPRGTTIPAAPSIDFASAYFVPDLDTLSDLHQGKIVDGYYRRNGHAVGRQLEASMTSLEAPGDDSKDSLALASGMTACMSLFWALLKPGAHVVCGQEIYGGTHSFLSKYAPRLSLTTSFVPTTPDAIKAAIKKDTAAVVVETITNPLMRVPNIPDIVRAAKGIPVFVDNTFATPILARPLEWGVSAVWHSATKYLSGHADAICGVITGSKGDVAALRSLSSSLGGAASPMDAWLTLRGIRTLEVRVRKACDNALELAERLSKEKAVASVNYPGLKESRDRELASRLLEGGFGAMMSFEIKGGLDAAKKFVKALEMIHLLPSLGDVETTVSHPARSSHAYLTPAERALVGVTDGLIRVSTGIENIEDIYSDLKNALTRSQK